MPGKWQMGFNSAFKGLIHLNIWRIKYSIMVLQNSARISNEKYLKTVFSRQGAVQGNISCSFASYALIGFLPVIL